MTNPYLKFYKQARISLNRYTKEIKWLKDSSLFTPEGRFPAQFSIPAMLPWWLSEIFELGIKRDQICSALSLGNLYGVSYIRSIGQSEGIGGFFLFKAIKEYQRIFSSDSRFWDYPGRYIKEAVKYFEFCQQGFMKIK